MSAYSVIHDISHELRTQMFDALASTPGLDLALTTPGANIALDPPGQDLDSAVRLTAYLYHVDLNKNLRNQPMLAQPGRPDEQRLPPVPLQLRYLVTPVHDEEDTNHLIIGRLIEHFHDQPSFATLTDTPVGDSFGGGSPELRVRIDMLTVEQLAQVWNAFSQPYRLSVVLLIEVVSVDSGKPPLRAPRVVDAYALVGIRDSDA